ncbi:MAG: hypothetical protein ABDH18_05875 [Aquificaceae bacterium]
MHYTPTCHEYYRVEEIVQHSRKLKDAEAIRFLESRAKELSKERALAISIELMSRLNRAGLAKQSYKLGISSLREFLTLYSGCFKNAASELSSSSRFIKKEKELLKEYKQLINTQKLSSDQREILLFEAGMLEFEVGSEQKGLQMLKQAQELCIKAQRNVCYDPLIDNMEDIIKNTWKGR